MRRDFGLKKGCSNRIWSRRAGYQSDLKNPFTSLIRPNTMAFVCSSGEGCYAAR